MQMHMIKKGHCFMQTTEIYEYSEFYDLSKIELKKRFLKKLFQSLL